VTKLAARTASREPLRLPVAITVTVHRVSARKSDATNLAPTAKACIDGLVDAGWLPDDDDTRITSTTFVAGHPRKPPALTITITEQGDRA
jgi:Holliday junction resolvase RusA-like endonuclease